MDLTMLGLAVRRSIYLCVPSTLSLHLDLRSCAVMINDYLRSVFLPCCLESSWTPGLAHMHL